MPGSSEQNDVAERRNRTLMEMVRSMISRTNLPGFLWGKALKTALYILNVYLQKLFHSLLLSYGLGVSLA